MYIVLSRSRNLAPFLCTLHIGFPCSFSPWSPKISFKNYQRGYDWLIKLILVYYYFLELLPKCPQNRIVEVHRGQGEAFYLLWQPNIFQQTVSNKPNKTLVLSTNQTFRQIYNLKKEIQVKRRYVRHVAVYCLLLVNHRKTWRVLSNDIATF